MDREQASNAEYRNSAGESCVRPSLLLGQSRVGTGSKNAASKAVDRQMPGTRIRHAIKANISSNAAEENKLRSHRL
jgi:hypothetical protein